MMTNLLLLLGLFVGLRYTFMSGALPNENSNDGYVIRHLRGAISTLTEKKPVGIPWSTMKGPARALAQYPYTDVFRPMFKEFASRQQETVSQGMRSSLSVAVGIMSEESWADIRNIHRASWMRSSCVSKDVTEGGVVPFFVLSGPPDGKVEQEMLDHADIMILPTAETPRNKTFAWIHEAVNRMPGATFYAKMDSDTILDPCALLSDLASLRLTPSQSLYYGHTMLWRNEFVCSVPETSARMPSLCSQASFAIEDAGEKAAVSFPSAVDGVVAMHGAFYLTSADIARWMAEGGDNAVHFPITMERTWGNGEDIIFADWVARFFQVNSKLQPRIKNRAAYPEPVFRHLSDLLTIDQKVSIWAGIGLDGGASVQEAA